MKLLIFISILLYSCGEHFDGFDKVYQDTMVCTGLSANQPEVEIVDKSEWPFNKYDGYYYKSGKIIIKKGYLTNDLLSHEYVHHLLEVNEGDLDACHTNILFLQCSTSNFGKC